MKRFDAIGWLALVGVIAMAAIVLYPGKSRAHNHSTCYDKDAGRTVPCQ